MFTRFSCPGPHTKVSVPGSRFFVAKSAEQYFCDRLTVHYEAQGYICFSEYGHAGGTTTKPRNWGLTHTNAGFAKVLDMLRSYPFKPDFMAVKPYHGLIAEVGTVDDKKDKIRQVKNRLLLLQNLSNSWEKEAAPGEGGRQAPRWERAQHKPPEGPIVFPCGQYEICTDPTWRDGWGAHEEEKGVLLYEVHRENRDKEPHTPLAPPMVRRLPRDTEEDLRNQTRNRPVSRETVDRAARQILQQCPRLLVEIGRLVLLFGAAAAVAAIVAALAASAPVVAAGVAVGVLAVALVNAATRSSQPQI